MSQVSERVLLDRAEALEAFASLLRAGFTIDLALEEWPNAVPPRLKVHLAGTARRAKLGDQPSAAVTASASLLGDDTEALQAALELHRFAGVDPVPLVAQGANNVRRRAEADATGKAASSGAKLSGWMVGGLPLVALPMAPISRAPLLDTPGIALLASGLLLTAAGMYWMFRLVPAGRPSDEPTALFLDHVVAALRAGAPLDVALHVTSRLASEDLREDLARARRRTVLGQSWSAALTAVSEERFGAAAAALERADRLGLSPVGALMAVAESRRAAARHEFERAVRRAPVLMVLPLVLCVLPAFGILAIVPFLRSVAFG